MNIDNFANLDGSLEANEETFGSKIHMLSKLLIGSVPVPRGFYFAVTSSPFLREGFAENEIAALKYHYERLFHNSPTKPCIVRSSASVENKPGHQFSGLFESRKNVKNFDELLESIRDCIASKNADKIRNYAFNFGLNVNDIRLAILVQNQVEPLISGLAHLKLPYSRAYPATDYIEVTDGDMEGLITGGISPVALELQHEHGSRPVLSLRSHRDSPYASQYTSTLNIHLAELATCFRNIKGALKQNVLVEFCIEQGNGTSVFQAKPYEVLGVDPLRHYKDTRIAVPNLVQHRQILDNEKKWGLKGAAMVHFKKMDLFHPPFIYFESGTTLFKIQEELRKLPPWPDGLTIRYSRGDDIGLPRIFVEDQEEAYLRIAEEYERTRGFFTMVHGYLRVERSYELIVDKEYVVLEHIPGLWESDNTLEPDVMILDGGKASLLKVKERRRKQLVSPRSVKNVFEEPQEDEFFRLRFASIINLSESVIKPHFGHNLPLNFHFVETDGMNFNFLNIRRLSVVNRKYVVRGGSFFHVRTIDDLAGWDGKKPILLRISIQRGKERDLIDLATVLPKGTEIYITFGYLSHPAILLREFGVNVIPAYFNREIKEIKI